MSADDIFEISKLDPFCGPIPFSVPDFGVSILDPVKTRKRGLFVSPQIRPRYGDACQKRRPFLETRVPSYKTAARKRGLISGNGFQIETPQGPCVADGRRPAFAFKSGAVYKGEWRGPARHGLTWHLN